MIFALASCASPAPDSFDLELTKTMQQCLQKIQEATNALSPRHATEPTTPGAKFKECPGKGRIANNEGVRVVWNNEKSFYHGAMLAGTLPTAVQPTTKLQCAEPNAMRRTRASNRG